MSMDDRHHDRILRQGNGAIAYVGDDIAPLGKSWPRDSAQSDGAGIHAAACMMKSAADGRHTHGIHRCAGR